MNYRGQAKASDRFIAIDCGCVVVVPGCAEAEGGVTLKSEWAYRCTRDKGQDTGDMLRRMREMVVTDFFTISAYHEDRRGRAMAVTYWIVGTAAVLALEASFFYAMYWLELFDSR